MRLLLTLAIAIYVTPAVAAPVEVILQVDPLPAVAMTIYGDLGGHVIQEQIPGGLQSTISGNVRVRFDPANPNSIEFLSAGSHLDLSNGSLFALPGLTPANFAGVTPAGTMFGIHDASLKLSSGPLTMTPSGTSHTFPSNNIGADFVRGRYRSTSSPTNVDLGRFASLSGNSFGIDGSFTWFPTATGDNLFVILPIQYQYQPLGPSSSDQINFVSQVRMFASFSIDNVADVGAEGGTVEVLGGASVPGGVSATITDVTEPGSFTAQQIGLEGLPAGALEQAHSVSDLAYSLSLADYTNPCFVFEFTGKASAFEITLNCAEYTNPGFSYEDRLVLYHYNHTGAWEKVAGQILNTQLNTIKFTSTDLSPFMLAISIPEPSSLFLAALGLVGFAAWGWRRKRFTSASAAA